MRFLLIFVFVFTQAQHSQGVMIDIFELLIPILTLNTISHYVHNFTFHPRKTGSMTPTGWYIIKGNIICFFSTTQKPSIGGI